jgi:Uma2 family endonuclease
MATDTATGPAKMTAEEFYDWANRPENAGKNYELDSGEVVEVPPPKHIHGVVCWIVSAILGQYVIRRGAGYACTNDTGIIVGRKPDTVRGADLMLFLQSKRWDQLTRGYVEDIPNLIVEVLSPDDRPSRTNRRIEQYLRRGVPLVWLIDAEDRTVTVFRPDEFHKVLDETDTLSGNGVLPDFSCRVADLFTLPGQQPINNASPNT